MNSIYKVLYKILNFTRIWIFKGWFCALFLSQISVMGQAATLDTVTGTGDSPPMNINSLVPIVNNDSLANFQVDQLLFSYLIFVKSDLSIDWSKSVARSISFNNSRTRVVIKLNNRRWSNGHLVTANDLVYGFQLIKQYGLSYPNYGMGGMPNIIKKMIVVNSHEVILHLKRPVNPSWFELNGISQLVPLPRFAWKQYSLAYIYKHQGSPSLLRYSDGPYRLDEFHTGRYLMLSRNNHYSGPPVHPKHIVFYMYPLASGEFLALKSGHIDLGNVPHLLLPAQNLVHNLRTCVTNGGYGINYIPLNFRNASDSFFKDISVRQALEMAIDQQQIINVAYHGLGKASFSPVPSNPPTFLSPQMKLAVNHPANRFSVEQADRLLTDDGWLLDSLGIRRKNGKTLIFSLLVSSASRTNRVVAELIQDDWRKIGVIVHIHLVPFNVELSRLANPRDWDSAIIPWIYSPDYYPSGDGLFNTNGGTNYGGYSSPEMDKLIKQTTSNPGKSALFAYQDFAAKHLPVIFLPTPDYLIKYRSSYPINEIDMALSLVSCGQPAVRNR